MIHKIVKDPMVLTQMSDDFVHGEDDSLIDDLIDTAKANIDKCAGIAAIQIGVRKRLVLVRIGDNFMVFCNPAIVKRSAQTYMANEGCLSLDGTRNVKRHRTVMVSWTDRHGKRKVKEFSGFTAQVLQHEIDHTKGKLI